MSDFDQMKDFIDKPSKEIFSKTFENISFKSFDNDYIEQLGRSKKKASVSNCTFRSTIFVDCYFNGVVFKCCDFTSAKFIDCNFKDAKFVQCVFNYASFRRTIVDSSEILANLPREPNLCRDLLRVLRVDARELGNVEDESVYIRKEIEASNLFYISAFKGREDWYRKKYSGMDRVLFLFKWMQSMFSGLIWGNGEKPARVLYSCVFTVLLISLLLVFYGYNEGQFSSEDTIYSGFAVAFKLSVSEFLGIPYDSDLFNLKVPFVISVFSSLARYIFIGLLVSVMFRSFSRR
ncbi:pentapeptide repeat-containing protein [Vreelandella aquamarina]|uniref:Pentapeptide repeat-containing protein n=1 Tax=Vreelandella aquamarina TaxID=77097 RepID=A0A857GI21_9GAMM|nr:pentapeptide repeat-containing protein [Halomonas meridiana]QHD48910.1 hypothetical protein CTT34_03995 [Halomonas meridiana]